MPFLVHIPGPLREHTGGSSRVELVAELATVGDVLEALFALHPGLRDRVMTEQGLVRPHVNVFVGSDSIRYVGGLSAPVAREDEVSIVPAVSGGV